MKKLLLLLFTSLLTFTSCDSIAEQFPDFNLPKDFIESIIPTPEQPEVEQPDVEQPDVEQPEVEQPEVEHPEVEQPTTPEHSHSYNATVTAPTCEKEGYTTYVCSCGDSYVADQVNSLGHTEETIKGKDATCSTVGLTDGVKCSVCKEILVEQEEIPTIDHNYNATVTAPTCEKEGYTTYVCVCGDSYVANQTSALGHSWEEATTQAPKTCKTCGKTEGEKLPTPTPSVATLSVDYINVGQGDSILIKVEDCDILIDGGKSNAGSTVSSYLKNKKVDDIELMINTHFDEDHYGGLTTVLNNYVVEKFWCTSFNKTSTSTLTTFKNAVKKDGLSLTTPSVGTTYTYEALTLTVLYSGAGAENSNDSSLVVMLEYGSFRFLFTGDISSTIETKLVQSKIDLTCDVLKVAHHGSRYSSNSSFLKATGAKYGIICVGDNTYGHPTSTALNNLSAAGISVYRTDKNGTVVFTTNGTTMQLPNNGGNVNKTSTSTSSETTIAKQQQALLSAAYVYLPTLSKRNYLY